MEAEPLKIDDSGACSEYLFEKYRYDNGQVRKSSNGKDIDAEVQCINRANCSYKINTVK